jgi:tetratricopeptide (TPR) repeat protein
MRFRYFGFIAVSAAACLAASGTWAAVTVLGNGAAHSCYQYAEFGGSSSDSVTTCDFALEQTTLAVKDRAATFVNRGILRARRNEPENALADYDHGIALNPSLGEAYVDRGAIMIVLKRYDDALADLDKGISLGANLPQIAYYDRAIVDEALGNIRAAYEDYKKAAEIQPDFILATDKLARFRVVRKSDGT